jgi:hypothetical protein
VEFCADVASYQRQLHRYFIIENPETSQIWNTEPMSDIANMQGVHRSIVHMCAYGLKGPVSSMPMKKPMSFLHNIPMTMFADLIKQCRGDHEHQQIVGSARGHGSRAVLSQAYPWTCCQKLASVLSQVVASTQASGGHCVPAVATEFDHCGDLWEELADIPGGNRSDPEIGQ